MKLDGVALIQPSKTKHSQGGAHIYGVVPHPQMLEVDMVNSYLNYFVKKDYDYVGYIAPGIHFQDSTVIKKLALGLGRWNLDVISPECAEDLVTHGMGLRDGFEYGMLHPYCWLTTSGTVRAILDKYGFFLDPRYKTLKYIEADLSRRLKDTDFISGLHRGVEFYGTKEHADSLEDWRRYDEQYAIRTSGEEEDGEPLEYADYDEQERRSLSIEES